MVGRGKGGILQYKLNFEISHGILPILSLNFTRFEPFLQTFRNLAKI